MNITVSGQQYDIHYVEEGSQITRALLSIPLAEKPRFMTYDTETDGLHIKKARPFWGAICYGNQVYVFPTTKEVLKHMKAWAAQVDRMYGHNVLFDMNMTANVMGDKFILDIGKWGDTMALVRLTTEAKSQDKGGFPMGLKKIAKRAIDPQADKYEFAVKAELKRMGAGHRKILKAMLNTVSKKVTLKMIDTWQDADDDFSLADHLDEKAGLGHLADDVERVYEEWVRDCKPPTYEDVPREIMLPYLATDVIYTAIIVDRCTPIIEDWHQVETLNREAKTLPVTFRMMRQGLKVNRPYLEESKIKLDEYISSAYEELHSILGEQVNVNQHAKIKNLFIEILRVPLPNLDKKRLKKLERLQKMEFKPTKKVQTDIINILGVDIATLSCQEEVVEFLSHMRAVASQISRASVLIARLRRFIKWRQTYISRILEGSEYDGYYYMQINPYNPVSGRFSGDVQQFPKDPIYTPEGYSYEMETGKRPPDEMIMYHPRRAFEGDMVFIDWSQVELRLQAHYTLAFGGDLNLCRAYMPFKCTHYLTGEVYKFDTAKERGRWSELRQGAPTDLHWEEALGEKWSVWIVPETGEAWVPTDLHMSTALQALSLLKKDVPTMTKDELKAWRNRGKTTNFAKNYGSGEKNIAETLEVALEVGRALSEGYKNAFPKVLTYQEFVSKRLLARGYVQNLFGRRYYLSDSRVFYRCGNYLIQGSGADLLKEKMIACQEFIDQHNLKTTIILCVHDEIGFRYVAGEEWAIAEFKKIMEDVPQCLVPIVAEVEYTNTVWAEKKPFVIAA